MMEQVVPIISNPDQTSPTSTPTATPTITATLETSKHVTNGRCGCGCVPNILSLFEMAALRAKLRKERERASKSQGQVQELRTSEDEGVFAAVSQSVSQSINPSVSQSINPSKLMVLQEKKGEGNPVPAPASAVASHRGQALAPAQHGRSAVEIEAWGAWGRRDY